MCKKGARKGGEEDDEGVEGGGQQGGLDGGEHGGKPGVEHGDKDMVSACISFYKNIFKDDSEETIKEIIKNNQTFVLFGYVEDKNHTLIVGAVTFLTSPEGVFLCYLGVEKDNIDKEYFPMTAFAHEMEQEIDGKWVRNGVGTFMLKLVQVYSQFCHDKQAKTLFCHVCEELSTKAFCNQMDLIRLLVPKKFQIHIYQTS